MSELATEYEGKVFFNVVSGEDTQKRGDEIDSYGFTEARHGIVAFNTEGEVVSKIPGHSYGRAEIVAMIDEITGD